MADSGSLFSNHLWGLERTPEAAIPLHAHTRTLRPHGPLSCPPLSASGHSPSLATTHPGPAPPSVPTHPVVVQMVVISGSHAIEVTEYRPIWAGRKWG